MSTSALLASAPAPAPAPAGGPPPAPAPAGGTPPAPAPAPAPTAPAWLTGADETTVGYVANKGWTEPKQVLEGYRNLEKLLGADKAGNAVIVPKEGATPEEQAAFFNRLGRPTDPAGYQIEVPQGGNKDFATAAAAKFHELGLTKAQGEALAKWNNEQVGAFTTQTAAARQAEFEADDAALKTGWGQAFAQNVAQAQAGMRAMGLDAAAVDKLQGALGHKGTMEFLQKIGARTGEATFVAGSTETKFGNALTPGQAKARIAELRNDKDWVKRYQAGGMKSAEFNEMQRLQAFANPEESN